MLMLAQSMQSVSVENFGMVALAVMFGSKWLWDYSRSRREAEGQHEPKATPPLHRQFVTREEFQTLAARVDAIACEVHDGFAKLDHKRSVSVANLHSAITALGTALRGEIKNDTKAVHDRVNEVLSAVSELKGRVESK